jgi:hypothetical protein
LFLGICVSGARDGEMPEKSTFAALNAIAHS